MTSNASMKRYTCFMLCVIALVLKQKVEKFMFPMIQLSTGCVQVKKICCAQHVVHSLLFIYDEFLRCVLMG